MVKKVNDFQNGDVKADIIVLRSVFGKVGQNYLMQPQRDPNTGMLPSCVRRVDSHGDMILSADDRIAMLPASRSIATASARCPFSAFPLKKRASCCAKHTITASAFMGMKKSTSSRSIVRLRMNSFVRWSQASLF